MARIRRIITDKTEKDQRHPRSINPGAGVKNAPGD
jgi:hypothetical protein